MTSMAVHAVVTGMPRRRITFSKSAWAPLRRRPEPTSRTGRSASSRRRTTSRHCSRKRAGCSDCVLGRIVAGQGFGIDLRGLHVDRDIDPARAGPPARGEMERALEMVADRVGILDQHRVFGDVSSHRHDIDFLVAELAQLAGQVGEWSGASRASPGRR